VLHTPPIPIILGEEWYNIKPIFKKMRGGNVEWIQNKVQNTMKNLAFP
jgi:hypothetical protein